MPKLRVDKTWNGSLVGPEETAEVEFFIEEERLHVLISAPFHGDAPPASPAGSTDRLWEHEAVELFLAGEDSRYLELEFGPHGHYLVLQFEGVRQAAATGIPLEYRAEISGNRWRGEARLPYVLLPTGTCKANAYGLHGLGEARRYLAAFSLPGDAPDFHQPAFFPGFSWTKPAEPEGSPFKVPGFNPEP